MKQFKMKKLLSFLLCFIMLFGMVPTNTVLASGAKETIPDVSQNLYGYGKLTDSNEKNIYAVLLNGMKERNNSINVSAFNIDKEKLNKIMSILLNDNPALYYVDNGWRWGTSNGNIVSVSPNYSSKTFEHAKFENIANNMVSVAGGGSEYEKGLALHDALVKHIVYDLGAGNAHSAYGAFVDGKAVCEGYAKAYQYLLQKAGIQSYIVTGVANGGSHAWNLVKFDGAYYHVDVTWDDPVRSKETGKPLYHAYFALSDQEIGRDHQIMTNELKLDPCGESKLHPDLVKLDTLTVDAVAKSFKHVGRNAVGRIYYTGNEDFNAWFRDNIFEAIKGSPVPMDPGSKVSCSNCGREYQIVYTASSEAHTHTGELVSGQKASCTEAGWKDYYKCDCGKFFEDSACEKEIRDLATWKTGAGKMEATGHRAGNWEADGTNHWKTCETCHAELERAAHTYGEWIIDKEATEAASGQKSRICSVCSHKEIEVIPQLTHKHRGIKVSGQKASCTEAGWKDYYKCDCGKFFEDSACEKEIRDLATWKTGAGKMEATGHRAGNWEADGTNHWKTCETCHAELERAAHTYGEWIPVTEATETEEGLEKHICTVCEYEEKRIIPAIGGEVHKHRGVLMDGKAPTCTESGWKDYYRCDCGTFFEDEECAKEISNLEEWKNREGKISASLHVFETWNFDKENHWQKCKKCGEEAHKAAHTYGEWIPVTEATETEEGLEKHICTVCEYEERRTIPAIGGEVHKHNGILMDGKTPTCTESGWKDYYRCDCGKNFEDSACAKEILDVEAWKEDKGKLQKVAHTYGDWIIVREPGKGTNGLKKQVCTICGHEETKVIPALVEDDKKPVPPQSGTTPVKPSKPAKPSKPVQNNIPKTGDESDLIGWMLISMMSLSGTVAILLNNKKNKRAK